LGQKLSRQDLVKDLVELLRVHLLPQRPDGHLKGFDKVCGCDWGVGLFGPLVTVAAAVAATATVAAAAFLTLLHD
jgi:hypothetical protein